nr:hypothetical protein [uncultured Comamonas sp.]
MPKRGNRGSKPSVAFKNQSAAKSNIQAKLELLSRIVADLATTTSLVTGSEKIRETLGTLPSSARQFNAWTGSQLPHELLPSTPLRVNAQQTLKGSGLLESVDAATRAVKELGLEAVAPSKKEERLAHTVRRAKLAEELRKIAEREIFSLKRAHANALDRIKDLESQLASLARESQSRIAALEADWSKERRARAAAKGSAGRVTSLREVKNGQD